MPAFFVALCLAAFIVGPLVSNFSLIDYFKNVDNYNNNPVSFVLYNITFNVQGYAWDIYDLFSTNPYPSSINGSMWTLKFEVACYLFLIVISFFGLLRYRKLHLLFTAILGILVFCYYNFQFILFDVSSIKGLAWENFEYINIILLGYFFSVGSLIYLFKR